MLIEADITERLKDVTGRIDTAAARAARGPQDVTLVAISKTQPDARIDAALAAVRAGDRGDRTGGAVGDVAPRVGLEPTTYRLTVDCSAD